MSQSASAAASVPEGMNPRLAEEWTDVLELCPDAEFRTDPERVELTVELDGGQYSTAATPVAVPVPAGYRATGPDGFFVPTSLRFSNGGGLPASDATGAGMPGWLLVSFHHVDETGGSTWRPTADPKVGDNFVGYIGSIESFLARSCN